MASKKVIAWGCGAIAAVGVLGVAAAVLFLAYVAQDLKGVGVSIDGSTDVMVGETFELSVTITNERLRKALALSDIDVA